MTERIRHLVRVKNTAYLLWPSQRQTIIPLITLKFTPVSSEIILTTVVGHILLDIVIEPDVNSNWLRWSRPICCRFDPMTGAQVITNWLVTQSHKVVRYDLSWSSWPPWTGRRWGVPVSTGHWSGQTELSRVSHKCSAFECAFSWQGKLDGLHLYTFPKYGPCFWDPPLCDPQNVEPQKSDPLRRDSKKWQEGKLFPWARHWSLKPEGCESCMQTVLAWTNAIAQLLWFLRNILTSRSLESGSSFLSVSLVIALAMWPKLNCIFINRPT